MNRLCLSAAFALTLIAGSAVGQSFNVDFNTTSSSTVPASTYGAAAAQPGTWNSVFPTAPLSITLKNLDGTNSAVTLSRNASGVATTFGFPASSNFDNLMDDYFELDSGDPTMTFTFNNLSAGTYILIVYAQDAQFSANVSSAISTGSLGTDSQQCGGAQASNTFNPGSGFMVWGKSVAAGGSFSVQTGYNPLTGRGIVNGMQLIKMGRSDYRVYVNDNAPGPGVDGSSWATAFNHPQVALDFARRVGPGLIEAWVASGIYKTTSGSDKNISFDIPSGMRLFGGFSGSETSLSQRTSPAFFITALNGSITGGNAYTVVKMTNCTSTTVLDGFSITNGNNTSDGKGGGLKVTGGAPVLNNLRFLSNSAGAEGAGLYVTNASLTLTNGYFFNNDSNGTGGALHKTGTGNLTLVDCTFLGNESFAGGAIYFNAGSHTLRNNLFSGNKSFDKGGAIYQVAGTTDLTNCTLSGNTASFQTGGHYINNGGSTFYKNSIVWGNTDAGGFSNTFAMQFTGNAGSSFTANYTTVQGLVGSLNGFGNNALNPQFIDANGANNIAGDADDNCRLSDISPAVDSGNNALSTLLTTDLDGNARFVDDWTIANTGAGTAPIVDRGAYERQFTPCPADFDESGFVDSDDFVFFLDQFARGCTGPGQGAFGSDPNCFKSADYDQTGFVDSDDYVAFNVAFETPCGN